MGDSKASGHLMDVILTNKHCHLSIQYLCMLVHGIETLMEIVDGHRDARQGHRTQGPGLQSEHHTSHPDILHKSDSLLLPFTRSSFNLTNTENWSSTRRVSYFRTHEFRSLVYHNHLQFTSRFTSHSTKKLRATLSKLSSLHPFITLDVHSIVSALA